MAIAFELHALAGLVLGAGIVGGLGSVAAYHLVSGRRDDADPLDSVDGDVLSPDDDAVPRSEPDMSDGRFGVLGTAWRLRRNKKKREKLTSKGYVEWYLIDDTYPEPKYVKPKRKGGGVAEIEHDGEVYLFPEQAMVPNAKRGMWTVFHKRGDSEPINIREPEFPSMKADEIKDYLTKRVTAEAPGLFSQLGLTPQKILRYGIVAIVAYALIQNFMSGGGVI